MKSILLLLFISFSGTCFGQNGTVLTIDKIMQDPKWIGTSPSNLYWSKDGKYLFFNWNPENNIADSLYYITTSDYNPRRATYQMQQQHVSADDGNYNATKSGFVYEQYGDIYFIDVKADKLIRVTQTMEMESNPVFISNTIIAFTRNQNLYSWDKATGSITQLTNFIKTSAPKEEIPGIQDQWLKENQLSTSAVLRSRKFKRDSTEAVRRMLNRSRELRPIYIEDKLISDIRISPGGRYITYKLTKAAAGSKSTIIPNYMAEGGFTQDISGRTKVGTLAGNSELFIYDTQRDSILTVKVADLAGIKDLPDYAMTTAKDSNRINKLRTVSIFGPSWNETGSYAVVDIRSADHKDRWLMLLDAATGKLTLFDRQRDEAWIAGPGISVPDKTSWIDEHTIWFQSEASGYSHLYKMNLRNMRKEQLTKGNFEILQVNLTSDKKTFYISSNKEQPGEQHVYRLPVMGGEMQKITTMKGAHQAKLSPDGKHLAYLYSYTNKPWELFIQPGKLNAKPVAVTTRAQTDSFKQYNWRDPELISFAAGDGEKIFARLYKPAFVHPDRPAVIFVHGAGYLQNAHKWWSSYFREYMFHNLLADLGYTVLDIDYRGSAGYGRNWRTGIYRHMGGKDLTDHIDGAKLLTDKYGVDPKHIGIYGGSYGGFITLMAMFTKPGTFAAGAALRSVTDWAHYNQGYTSNILNEPAQDSIAYKKSSPIYYAEGLEGALLMCHGMVDVNVHFQDIVRLTQRLIELKKENWELAVYPVEDHAFTEPSSWADEYKRILKLFEMNLKTSSIKN